ncbi:2971_t:CDS:1, partial [Gigaspora rosea]
MPNDLTIEDVIKLVITKICTGMNINENDSEPIIVHISYQLSSEERTHFRNLTAHLNSLGQQDDYSMKNIFLNGCDFNAGLTARIKDYIDEQSRIRNGEDPMTS